MSVSYLVQVNLSKYGIPIEEERLSGQD